MDTNYDVVVIGGGASGMIASIFSARNGNKTLVLDHNEKLGKKLYITGKGKCNLTNNSSIENHLNNIVTNPRFMIAGLNAFSPTDTINFFSEAGLELRTERGMRVFPKSDKSSDVIKVLEKTMQNYGVKISLNTEVIKVRKSGQNFEVLCNNDIKYTSSRVIVATGGLSYQGTGASALGYEIAKTFGHKIIQPKSSLCPIIIKEDVKCLNGLSLRNISLGCSFGKKKFSEFGDLLFTFNSLTGPTALTLSSKINKYEIKNTKIFVDLKPALSEEKLADKFKREFIEFAKKDLKNYLFSLLPSSMVDYFMSKLGINNKKVAEMTKVDRNKLIVNLKKFELTIKSLENINVGIVTSGGVDVSEINSKTCESKLVKGLYFTGEVLDVDALTGGYNLQIAWTTGYLAGNN